MRRCIVLIVTSFVLTLSAFTTASAKPMESRLGIGFKNAFPFDLPALAAQYYPNSNLGVTGALGVDTQENNSRFALQLGLRKRIFEEDNLNFFMGGNFSLLTEEIGTEKNSGYEIAALVSTEFFLPGLENLGFNMDAGVAVTSVDKVRFRTVGNHFLNGGVIFYF